MQAFLNTQAKIYSFDYFTYRLFTNLKNYKFLIIYLNRKTVFVSDNYQPTPTAINNAFNNTIVNRSKESLN